MKCKKCGKNHNDQYCPACGYTVNSNNYEQSYSGDYKKNPFTNETCWKCNKERGRRILTDPSAKNSDSYVRCFYCHRQESDKGFNHYSGQHDAAYIKKSFILMEYIQKPMFYGEEPDYSKYEELVQ